MRTKLSNHLFASVNKKIVDSIICVFLDLSFKDGFVAILAQTLPVVTETFQYLHKPFEREFVKYL